MGTTELWIVAYDTPSNRRRRKLAKLLSGYGQRLQWSVFECHLRRPEVQALVGRLTRLAHPDEDQVRLWPLPAPSCARVIQIGSSPPAPLPWDIIV